MCLQEHEHEQFDEKFKLTYSHRIPEASLGKMESTVIKFNTMKALMLAILYRKLARSLVTGHFTGKSLQSSGEPHRWPLILLPLFAVENRIRHSKMPSLSLTVLTPTSWSTEARTDRWSMTRVQNSRARSSSPPGFPLTRHFAPPIPVRASQPAFWRAITGRLALKVVFAALGAVRARDVNGDRQESQSEISEEEGDLEAEEPTAAKKEEEGSRIGAEPKERDLRLSCFVFKPSFGSGCFRPSV